MGQRNNRRSGRPASTPDERENQLISLAFDRAEKQMTDGTASAQVITHFLKLGSSRERMEQERLQNENLLVSAKIEQMASSARMETLYSEALDAMRSYSGQDIQDSDEEFYED